MKSNTNREWLMVDGLIHVRIGIANHIRHSFATPNKYAHKICSYGVKLTFLIGRMFASQTHVSSAPCKKWCSFNGTCHSKRSKVLLFFGSKPLEVTWRGSDFCDLIYSSIEFSFLRKKNTVFWLTQTNKIKTSKWLCLHFNCSSLFT